MPTIADRLKAGQGVTGLALESALWCRYCCGETESGAVIAPNDPNWDTLLPIARAAKTEPDAWLAMRDVYGEIGLTEPFRSSFANALGALWADGTEAVLARYVAGEM